MDQYIWNNGKDYFIEETNWDDTATTKLPAGTELCRYSDTTKATTGFYFASKTGKWIHYEK